MENNIDNRPKVSILIPVYNVERYLSKCLDSLINQTLKDIEIICINDGSTDNSKKILEEYAQKDKRIRVFHQENQGQGATRNKLIELANGEFIGWVDSDDWVSYDYYEKLYNACIENNADVSIANTLVYHSDTNLNASDWVNSNIFSVSNSVIDTWDNRAHVVYSCAIWNKIYKTELVKKLPKFHHGLAMDDVPFNFGAAILANRLILVPDTTYYYRHINSSVMNTINKNKRTFGIFTASQICRDFLMTTDLSQEEKDIVIQIMDNFDVINMQGYLAISAPEYKEEFFQAMKKFFANFKFANNKFATQNSFSLYYKILNTKTYKQFCKKNLFEKLFYKKIHKDRTILGFCGIKIKFKKGQSC